MSRRAIPSEIARWEGLSTETRFELASRYVRRAAAKLGKRYGTVGIGVGFRTTTRREPTRSARGTARSSPSRRSRAVVEVRPDEVCVQLVVPKKVGSMSPADPRRVPAHLVTSAVIGGTRRRVAIPTDVQERVRGALQGALAADKGIRVSKASHEAQRGSFCCVVETVSSAPKRLLLSCHHVLALSKDSPTMAPVDGTEMFDRDGGAKIGDLYDYATIRPRQAQGGIVLRGLDAALARLSVSDDPVLWGVSVRELAPPFAVPSVLHLLAPADLGPSQPRPGPLPAEFVGMHFNIEIPLGGNRTLIVDHAVQYRCAAVAGDSGSALVNATGQLVGMHFYGGADGVCYAIAARQLFADGVFTEAIRLPSTPSRGLSRGGTGRGASRAPLHSEPCRSSRSRSSKRTRTRRGARRRPTRRSTRG